jgi:hypothetical protein
MSDGKQLSVEEKSSGFLEERWRRGLRGGFL